MKYRIMYILLLVWSVFTFQVEAQTMRGRVIDAETGEPLIMASVFYSSNDAVSAGLQGDYKIAFRRGTLHFSMVGYKPQKVRTRRPDTLTIRLERLPDDILSGAVVVGKKKRYRRKDNPAVKLMRRVIAAKRSTRLELHDYYSYDKYSRLTLALNDVNPSAFETGKLKRFPFLREHLEVCNETGKIILPISVEETVSEDIYRRHPKCEKTLIKGKQKNGLGDYFYSGELVSKVLADCFTDINIYDDDIRFLQYRFTSPISSRGAINFYRYFITDTLQWGSDPAIKVDFTPSNPQDFGFAGSLYIAYDSTLRILRADINIPHSSDVNYVDRMRIIQDFSVLSNGQPVLVRDNMLVELKVADFLQQMMVKRVTDYSHFSFDSIADERFKPLGREITSADAMMRDEGFWKEYRKDPLSASEEKMGLLVKRLSKVRGFKPFIWVAKAFIENFVETTADPKKGSKVDIGPVNTFVSQNFVNGFRLRFGAQTTSFLNKRWFAKGYAAYGFKDHRWMGGATLTYSFADKGYLPREFPVNNLSFSFADDVMAPSDRFLRTDKDNVFTSFKWQNIDHMIYYRRWNVMYDKEWENNIRFNFRVQHETDRPTLSLFYLPLDGKGIPIQSTVSKDALPHLQMTDFRFSLAYSPGAKWINTKQRRYTPSNDYPTYSITHTSAFKGFLGADYNFQLTELSWEQRIWLNSWGKIDFHLMAGAEWNRVPFPLLITPPANLSYILQTSNFNMIRNLEFANDRYASLFFKWDLNGKILNRLPLLRKLKWREILGVNVLWGTLTSKNNPTLQNNANDKRLFYFPGIFEPTGEYNCITRPMNSHIPYVEVVAGVHNVFRILHLEYVRRLTYRKNLPKHMQWGGVRAALRISF